MTRPPIAHGLVAVVAGGCGMPSTVVTPASPADARVERIADADVDGVAAAATAEILFSSEATVTAIDVTGASAQVIARPTGRVLSAAEVEGRLLVATDGGLRVWDGEWAVSGLSEALPRDPVSVRAHGDGVWLQTAAGVHFYEDGWLAEVSVDGASTPGPVGPGAAIGDTTVYWVTSADGPVALRRYEDGFDVIARLRADDVRAMAVDAARGLWVAADGAVLHHDGRGWERFELPATALDVLAGGDVVWVLAEDGAWSLADGEFARVIDGVIAGPVAVDPVGRLLVASEAGIDRHSLGRPIVVLGVAQGDRLEVQTEVRVAPTQIADVTDITAAIDGTPLAVDDGYLLVDPFELDLGPHELTVDVTWSDGGTGTWSAGFDAAAIGRATWVDDIEPLYTARCAICHGGGSATVLDTAERWQARIDDILAAVESERMPLQGGPLDAVQIATIRAWQLAGFPMEGE